MATRHDDPTEEWCARTEERRLAPSPVRPRVSCVVLPQEDEVSGLSADAAGCESGWAERATQSPSDVDEGGEASGQRGQTTTQEPDRSTCGETATQVGRRGAAVVACLPLPRSHQQQHPGVVAAATPTQFIHRVVVGPTHPPSLLDRLL